MINLNTDAANVTDQKFYFDLDADGELDEISTLASGSGFLALDKNGDGIINDGSELFGTKAETDLRILQLMTQTETAGSTKTIRYLINCASGPETLPAKTYCALLEKRA